MFLVNVNMGKVDEKNKQCLSNKKTQLIELGFVPQAGLEPARTLLPTGF